MIHAIGDTHLGHELIAKVRGYVNGADHDEAVISSINQCVAKSDRLIIVGDFCKDKPHKWKQAIKCRNVFLIIGNHDSNQIIRAFAKGQSALTKMVRFEPGKFCFFSHYPNAFWPGSHIGEARGRVYVGSMHVYGHMHDAKEQELDAIWPARKSQDVGVDTALKQFGLPRPFSQNDIINRLWPRKGHHFIEKPWALAAIVDAQVTAAGMTAENQYRERCGHQVAYTDADFATVVRNMHVILNELGPKP
jgi:calcineurin-like phosphoesterase family protein